MRRVFSYAIIASFFCLGLWSSCAKESVDTSSEDEYDLLREWVSLNRPDLTEYYDGLFMKIYTDESNEVVTDSIEYLSSDWFEVTYTAQTLENNYYYNMYPNISDTLGYFSYGTRFVPDRVSYSDVTSHLSYAQVIALSFMNPLDSVEIVAASDFVYNGDPVSGTIPYGYNGNTSLTSDVPAIIRMKYNALITDMYAYYRTQVRNYATEELGLAVADSVKGVSMLYMKKLVENPLGDTIAMDSTVQIIYTGMFTDGFVFDTNDEDVAIANKIYDAGKSYDEYDFLYDTGDDEDSSDNITGFKETVINMRKGEKAIAVFTPNIGYGADGNSSSDGATTAGFTLIRANEPLVFIIEILDDDDDDE